MEPNTILLSAILTVVSWSLLQQNRDGKKLTRIDTIVGILNREVGILRRWRHSFGNKRMITGLEKEINDLESGEENNG